MTESAEQPRVFSPAATRELLPLTEVIPAVGHAFAGPDVAPERLVVSDEHQDWVVMPGLGESGGLVCKLLRVGRGTKDLKGLPTISGVVIALDTDGRLMAVLDGGTVTALRTAAVAAYATQVLARTDASVLALFGAGTLAEAHVEAIAAVRELTEIRVVGRSPERLRAFCERISLRGHDARPSDPHQALDGADIVVAVTTSASPVFSDEDIAPGVHINAMGSYRPERAEVPAETVKRARLIVETRESAWAEAGDLIQPLRAGLIGEDHVWAELRERERIASLRDIEPDAVTLFKSVGHVALDLAALSVAAGHLDPLLN